MDTRDNSEKIIRKYGSHSGMEVELKDFYGGGDEEVVKEFRREGYRLTVVTSQGEYPIALRSGDYLAFTDGSYENIKSKHDVYDE